MKPPVMRMIVIAVLLLVLLMVALELLAYFLTGATNG
jgi:hypothetical protein